MHGHKISLRIKSRGPQKTRANGSVEIEPIDTELLIDGKRAGLVQSVAIAINSHDMVPQVFLQLLPGELDIEIESLAVLRAALAQSAGGFLFGLDGSVAAPTSFSGHTAPAAAPCPPLPPLPPGDQLKTEWEKSFGPVPNVSAADLATWMASGNPPQGAAVIPKDAAVLQPGSGELFGNVCGKMAGVPLGGQGAPEIPEDALNNPVRSMPAGCGGVPPDQLERTKSNSPATFAAGFAALDELVSRGEHSQPIILAVKNGKVCRVTHAEYMAKQGPLGPNG